MSAWSPLGYFVSGFPASYAVELGSELTMPRKASLVKEGRVVSLRVGDKPVAVSDAERKDWESSLVAFMRAVNPQFTWNGGALPTHKPAYSQILIADDGRLWVKAAAPSRLDPSVKIPSVSNRVDALFRWFEPTIYDVIDPSGVYVGRVRYSDKMVAYPIAIRGDHFYSVREDEDGVQSVKRFRVSWNP
jgi:hypothetical protein